MLQDGIDFNTIWNGIIFLLFTCVFILSCLQLLDKTPKLKLNSDGIWYRRNILPFSKPKLIPWKNVDFFYFLQKTRIRFISRLLIIKLKDVEEEIKIDLNNLDKHIEDILIVMRNYAELNKFYDFGMEKKT